MLSSDYEFEFLGGLVCFENFTFDMLLDSIKELYCFWSIQLIKKIKEPLVTIRLELFNNQMYNLQLGLISNKLFYSTQDFANNYIFPY